MSAIPPKAERDHFGCDVRFVPKADIPWLFDYLVSAHLERSGDRQA
jgi:hypothetical protein